MHQPSRTQVHEDLASVRPCRYERSDWLFIFFQKSWFITLKKLALLFETLIRTFEHTSSLASSPGLLRTMVSAVDLFRCLVS